MIPRAAIILTHNRPELLKQCLDAVTDQVDKVLVIDNASDPPASAQGVKGSVMRVPDQPPNLSMMWNRGLRYLYSEIWDSGPIDIALLCDDVAAPEGWFDAVSSTMRRYNAAAASTHQYTAVPYPILKTAPDADLYNRMCGWAFVVAGEKNLRADEDLKWWWCDTHMDFQARRNGGMVIAPGPVAHNIHPNDFTNRIPGLAGQAGQDGLTFAAKWGGRPW